jgi:hypothetical protein
MYDRLKHQKSHYDVEKWKEESIKHDKLLKIHTNYPEKYESIAMESTKKHFLFTDRSSKHSILQNNIVEGRYQSPHSKQYN